MREGGEGGREKMREEGREGGRKGGREGGREEGREEATKNRELWHGEKGGRREKVAEKDLEAKAYYTNNDLISLFEPVSLPQSLPSFLPSPSLPFLQGTQDTYALVDKTHAAYFEGKRQEAAKAAAPSL